jgi:hypothetical protein
MAKVTARFAAHSGGSHQRHHGAPVAPGKAAPKGGVPKKASVETATSSKPR